jgi:hypothetical protein
MKAVAEKASAGRAPSRNSEVADRFDDIATMLELEGANRFRIRACRNVARSLRRHAREASDMIAAGEDLADLPGIGKSLPERSATWSRPRRHRCSLISARRHRPFHWS